MKEVNFYIPSKRIFHTTACIAQGLSELGFKVRSNVPFSFENVDSRGISSPFVTTPPLNFHEIKDGSDELYIVDVTHGYGSLENLEKYLNKKNLLLINMSDSSNFQDFPQTLRVATAHYNIHAKRSGMFYPLAFGLSSDIMDMSRTFASQYKIRKKKIIHNFKPSLSQGVRNFLAMSLEERLRALDLMIYQYEPGVQYAKNLLSTMFIAAYGGEIYRDLNKASLYGDNSFESNSTYKFKQLTREYVILRWDSWRFYEAAVFGCIPLQLNFERYGFRLHVPMPRHYYVDIDLASPGQVVEKIEKLSHFDDDFRHASEGLICWARANFSPIALANYVLQILGDSGPWNPLNE